MSVCQCSQWKPHHLFTFHVQFGGPVPVLVAHSSVPLFALSAAPLYGFAALAWSTPEPRPAMSRQVGGRVRHVDSRRSACSLDAPEADRA